MAFPCVLRPWRQAIALDKDSSGESSPRDAATSPQARKRNFPCVLRPSRGQAIALDEDDSSSPRDGATEAPQSASKRARRASAGAEDAPEADGVPGQDRIEY